MKTHPAASLPVLASAVCLAALLSNPSSAPAQMPPPPHHHAPGSPSPTPRPSQSPSPSPSATPDSPTPSPATPTPTPTNHTVNGQFRSSDGSSGTFVETFTVADAVTTDTIVYALTDGTTTSTETLTTTANADGTKTVVYSDLAFGASTAFTSTTTYTAAQGGSAVGTGTFTAADGTTGVLAAVSARNGHNSIVSTDFTSVTGVLTREVRLEEMANPGDVVKLLEVDAAGVLTTTTVTRFGGMHHQHP